VYKSDKLSKAGNLLFHFNLLQGALKFSEKKEKKMKAREWEIP
jgi:hypothetical protein